MASTFQKINHLYRRAGYGLRISDYQKKNRSTPEKEVKLLLTDAVQNKPIKVMTENPVAKYQNEFMGRRGGSPELRQMVQKEIRDSRELIRDMNMQWMVQLVDPTMVLREKLTLFWHDHFGVRNLFGYYAQQHNNLLREKALGKYGDLLLAVAKDPAMLQFLNNQQNVKTRPNENFARELLELFTLGRGNYSEQDIKNAARAFTGWGFARLSGNFRFRRFQHDFGNKEFMGQSGDLNGDDIINIVLEQKQTARFLASKLFHYYVSDTPDQEIIEDMANHLYKSDYHIGDLLNYMFSSAWFYEERFMNNMIKSPIDLVNSIRTQFNLSFGQPLALLYLQRSLGQVLFYPPSVNGWPVGREWIDSSSLVNRMRLPAVLSARAQFNVRPKDDGDENNQLKVRAYRSLSTAKIDWEAFESHLEGEKYETLLDQASLLLINQPLSGETRAAMLQELDKASHSTEPRQWLATNIAGLPQYQLS